MIELHQCADVLETYLRASRGPGKVDFKALSELQAKVAELLVEVDDAGLDPELRALLRRHIEAIDRAITESRVRGPAVLRDAVDEAVGAFAQMDETAKAQVQRTGIWTKAVVIIGTLSAMLNLGLGVPKAIDEVHRAITPGPPAVQAPYSPPRADSKPVPPPQVGESRGTTDTPAPHP